MFFCKIKFLRSLSQIRNTRNFCSTNCAKKISSFQKGHLSWLKGNKGKKNWMNLSGLHPHKKGEYKHSKKTKKKISKILKGKFSKKNHWNWQGGISLKSDYYTYLENIRRARKA